MNACSLISGYSRSMVPLNLCILLPGTVMSNWFQSGLAEKYLEGEGKFLPYIDLITHWIPCMTILIKNSKSRIRKRDVLTSVIFPWMYFSIGQKSKQRFGITDPFGHVRSSYPRVPIYVMSLYYIFPILATRLSPKKMRKFKIS